jgi:hypothetical protein
VVNAAIVTLVGNWMRDTSSPSSRKKFLTWAVRSERTESEGLGIPTLTFSSDWANKIAESQSAARLASATKSSFNIAAISIPHAQRVSNRDIHSKLRYSLFDIVSWDLRILAKATT